MSAWRHHEPHGHLARPFGADRFGRSAEAFARVFGTPQFILGQTALIAVWVAWNAWLALRWLQTGVFDGYPFVFLNLFMSLQAAYAAPLILLAQTRQAERERAWSTADAQHREELAEQTVVLIEQVTAHTTRLLVLVEELAARLVAVDSVEEL